MAWPEIGLSAVVMDDDANWLTAGGTAQPEGISGNNGNDAVGEDDEHSEEKYWPQEA